MIRNRLQNKLIVMLLLAIVLPVAVSIAVTYVFTIESIKNKTVAENSRLIFQGKTNITHYLDRINQSTIVLYSENVHSDRTSLFQMIRRGTNNHLSRNEIYRALQTIAQTTDHIRQIYFYSDTGEYAYLYMNGILKPGTVMDLEQITGRRPAYDRFIEPTHYSRNYGTEVSYPIIPPEPVFTMHHPIYDVPSRHLLGMLSIDIRLDYIREISEQLYIPDEEQFYLLDHTGHVVYSSDADTIGTRLEAEWARQLMQLPDTSGHFEIDSESFRGIHLYDRITTSYFDWMLVKRIPYESLYRDARQLTTINSLILALSLLVATAAILFITFKLTGRIKRLLRSINKVESGNMQIDTGVHSGDEIGVLANRFDQMVSRLNELVLKEYRLEIANKTNQLRALQAQIHPHFLNNTLQSIGTLALQQGQQQVYHLIASLGKMMRYHTDHANDLVPLERELEHVKAYLQLQKQRYEQNLKVKIDEDARANQQLVPKMILQPIVENYFKHGYDGKQKEAFIQIETRIQSGKLTIRIEDNGTGMSPEQIAQFNRQLASAPDPASPMNAHSGIGLGNVAARLKLYYDNNAAITLASRLPHGLVVCIRMQVSAREDRISS